MTILTLIFEFTLLPVNCYLLLSLCPVPEPQNTPNLAKFAQNSGFFAYIPSLRVTRVT